MTVKDVAACLHVSTREVIRMAEQKVLPGEYVRGSWQFRAGQIWNWIEDNLHSLPERRERDRHPVERSDLLISHLLRESAIEIDVLAKTRASILRELAGLAAQADDYVDTATLVDALQEREAVGSTALQDGIAIPHPARPYFTNGPLIVAVRTAQGIFFGQRNGGLTDLFFLVCCPSHSEHLLILGRLCRLLIEKPLQNALREAEGPRDFHTALCDAERALCKQ